MRISDWSSDVCSSDLYTSYEFGDAFVGGGVRYVGSVKTEIDRATHDLPSYTLVDASAGYDFGRFRAQVNVKNLFDKHYFVNNYQTLFYGNVVGEPRSVTVRSEEHTSELQSLMRTSYAD